MHFLSLLCPFGYPLVCLYLDVQHPMSCIMSLGFPGNTLYRCSCILALITVFHVCPAWQPFAPCCYVLDCFRGIFAQHASGTFLVWKTPASIDFVLRVYSCGVIISASVLSSVQLCWATGRILLYQPWYGTDLSFLFFFHWFLLPQVFIKPMISCGHVFFCFLLFHSGEWFWHSLVLGLLLSI